MFKPTASFGFPLYNKDFGEIHGHILFLYRFVLNGIFFIKHTFLCSLHKNKIELQTYSGYSTNTFDARQISNKT